MNLRPKKSFSFCLLLAGLIILVNPLYGDKLDEARVMESEGHQAEARTLYLSWLGSAANRSDERFGRILLHLIRMPGSVEEDIKLIEEYLSFVPSGEDRIALLEYAMVLNELRGTDSGRYRQQLPDTGPTEEGLIGRLPPGKGESLQDPCSGFGDFIREDFFRFLSYNSWEKETVLSWLEKAHTLHPRLLNSPDWLFQVIRVLRLYGREEEAEEFRVDLMTLFPDSLEADLLTGRVSLLPGPADLMIPPGRNGAGSEKKVSADEMPPVYIQVGAFSSYDNAALLKGRIEDEGLEAVINQERDIYKLIILSRDADLTESVMRVLGLEGFRIPRIP